MQYSVRMTAWRFGMLALACVLAAVAVAWGGLWFLAPLGLALLLYLLWTASTVREALLHGLIFGIATSGVSIYWFWDTLPLTWLGITNPVAQLVAVGGNWFIDTLALASTIALGAGAIWYTRRTQFLAPLLTAVIWMLAEEGRMWAFAIVNWAPQSLFGPHFSIASLGYTLANQSYLLRLAYPFGVSALNFIVAFIAAFVAMLFVHGFSRRARGFCLLVLLILLCAPLVHAPVSPSHTLRAALLYSDIPAGTSVPSQKQELLSLLQKSAADSSVQVIVFPEGEAPSRFLLEDERSTLTSLFGSRDVLLIYSRYVRTPEEARDGTPGHYVLTYESTLHGVLATYTKELLMPFGEYVPTYLSFFYNLISIQGTAYVQELSAGTARGTQVTVVPYGGAVIGALLCSDLHSPVLYHELGGKGATLFVNLSNQSWFNGSPLLFRKTLEIAKVDAVENAVPLIASDNEQAAFAIDARGHITAHSEGSSGVLFVDVLQ
jgi:apolipoprotein N-acyltransferase